MEVHKDTHLQLGRSGRTKSLPQHNTEITDTGNKLNHFHTQWHIKAFLLKHSLLGHNFHTKQSECLRYVKLKTSEPQEREREVSSKMSFHLLRTLLWHFST